MKTTVSERRIIVDKANAKLSIKKQCDLLSISRSGQYYVHKGESLYNLELMQEMDKEYTAHYTSPFF